MKRKAVAIFGMVAALSVVSAGTALAAKESFSGTYLELQVTSTSTSASGTVGNNDSSNSRYVKITTKGYDKDGNRLCNVSNEGEVTTGAKTAWNLKLTNNHKTVGYGVIRKDSSSTSKVQESKELEVYS